MTPHAEVVAAADRLSAAFVTRNVVAAMACFAPGDDIGYTGSEGTESACGRAEVEALLRKIFARAEAYSWHTTSARVHRYGDCAYLFTEAAGTVHADGGGTEPFAYRVSGVLEKIDGQWFWRHCHGSEPTGT